MATSDLATPLGPALPAPDRPSGRTADRLYGHAPSPNVHTFNVLCALAAAFFTGLRYPLGYGVTPGVLVAVALLPVWVPKLRAYAGARLVVGLGALTLCAGVALTVFPPPGRIPDYELAVSTSLTLFGIVAGAGVLMWVRTHVSLATTTVVFGSGLLASQLVYRVHWGTNPWKFALGIPVALIVLGLAHATRRRFVEIGALLALGAICAVQDSRSAFAQFVLAAVLCLWVALPAKPTARRGQRAARLLVLGALLAGAVYNIGSTLVLEGALGEAAQARSIAQVDASGSLLLGGRPELAATVALMRDEPAGFGPGAIPTTRDVLVAKQGMRQVNYEPDNGYVDRFMFGGQFRLHSVIGDLWAAFGPMGALWALTALVALVVSTAVSAATRTVAAVVVWLTCMTAWNLFFSPLFGSSPTITAALGLALVSRQPAERPYSSTRLPRTPARTPRPLATSR
jgi:hypothetical protein